GTRLDALGWRPLARLRCRIRPLDPAALLARRFGAPMPGLDRALALLVRAAGPRGTGAIRVAPLDGAGDELDRLWREVERDRMGSVVKDAAWVRWRFLDAPGAPYEVLAARDADGCLRGYAAVRLSSDGSIAYLSELVAPDREAPAAAALIEAAARW